MRARGDEFAPAGRVAQLLGQMASRPGLGDIPVACFYAFDLRTRMLPFLFYDSWMIPAGLVAIASAFHSAGFNTRGVYQLWTPNVRPSKCRIDGKPIQIMTTTAMQINSAPSFELIRDAWSMGEDRPLILAGGPKAVYEPDHYFGLGPDGDIHVDAAATGEELVLLELLDRLTAHRGQGETMRQAFRRCRDRGLLEDIPGLVYMSQERDRGGRPILYNTGVQRLVRDLDELPHPRVGLTLIEPKHRRDTLSPQPIPQGALHKNVRAISLVTTHGCRFTCPFCGISAYNQRTWRHKSPQRLADELKVLREQFNVPHFFGADDNFFNHRPTTESLLTALARTTYRVGGRTRTARQAIRFCTEATATDVYQNRDLIPLARDGGTWGIWFGIEDLAAKLVNKGQTAAKTTELFRLLNANDILPMVMVMHYDGQPLRTAGNDLTGLINQARFLFDRGAASYQCSLHSPAYGSREFEKTFRSGTVIKTAGGVRMQDMHYDGTHVVATSAKNPARIHWNLWKAYFAFYNPVALVKLLASGRPSRTLAWRVALHAVGLASLAFTVLKSLPWMSKEGSGRITYWDDVPPPKFPIRRLDLAPVASDTAVTRGVTRPDPADAPCVRR
ncbi:MAG: radical SAM protein [Planctomycetota bacterium]|nr:radical SAM protein [Planctomycetota bacterium]